MRNKNKNKNTFALLHPFFPGSTSLPLLLPHTSPAPACVLSMGHSSWQESLVLCGVSTGHSFLQGISVCFSMGFSTGCSVGCKQISALVPRAPPLPPYSLTLVLTGLFYRQLTSHSSLTAAACCFLSFFSDTFS